MPVVGQNEVHVIGCQPCLIINFLCLLTLMLNDFVIVNRERQSRTENVDDYGDREYYYDDLMEKQWGVAKI